MKKFKNVLALLAWILGILLFGYVVFIGGKI